MGVTPTSIDSYLLLFPHLEERCAKVLRGILHFFQAHPGYYDVTGKELDVFLNDPDAHKRLKDLADRGLLWMRQERPSNVEGFNKRAQAWAPTWASETTPVVHPASVQTHKQKLLKAAEEMVEFLEGQGWECHCYGQLDCHLCRLKKAVENK